MEITHKSFKVPKRKLSFGEKQENARRREASVQAIISSSKAPKLGKWRMFNKFLAK